MILIVTLNPLLERRFLFNKISFGSVNHCNSSSIALGGKGLNVSRQLKILGVNSFNFFFSGVLMESYSESLQRIRDLSLHTSRQNQKQDTPQ